MQEIITNNVLVDVNGEPLSGATPFALPTGTISMLDVREELKLSGTISLNDPAVRSLAGIPSGTISLNDLKGKSGLEPLQILLASTISAINGAGTIASIIRFKSDGWCELWNINSSDGSWFYVKNLTRWLLAGTPTFKDGHGPMLKMTLGNIRRSIGSDPLILKGSKSQTINGTTTTNYTDTFGTGEYPLEIILDCGYSGSMYTYTMKFEFTWEGVTTTKTANVTQRAG